MNSAIRMPQASARRSSAETASAFAPEIGRQRDRIFRRHQSRGDGVDASRIDAAGRHAAIARGIVGRHLRFVPFLGQRLARQHHVDRPGWIAVHEGAGAGERFLHDDAGGQRILPFDIGPHDAGDVEGILHEVYIGVARSGQFAMQREGRASGEQHHRQPIPKQVLDRHAGIGSSGVDMHEHRLSPAGRQRISAGHVNGDDLVRAEDNFRMLAAFAVPARDLLDQRDMIGAEIGEDIVNAEVDETFEEIMRGTVAAHSLFLVFPCRPSACSCSTTELA